jgi:ABC-type branched-subunit amino acid transport system ATPase component
VTDATSTASGVLEVRDVSLAFSGVTVLDRVSFSVDRGSLTAIVGPNGAGKSTMMHVIAGSQRPDSGQVCHQGRDITRLRPYRRARAGIVRTFQLPAEFGRLTALENLLVADRAIRGASFTSALLRSRRSWTATERAAVERARALLGEFGLAAKENEYAKELSGGQRRILELLRAVVAGPELLLLDEPFAGVHSSVIDRMSLFLEQLRGRGVTVLLIAHELDAVDRLCDSVVVMARGSVLYEGTMADARRQQKVVDAYVAG